MARVGRPATKTGAAAKKRRDAARKAYNALPLSKRQAIVKNRDHEAQRAASHRRDVRDRKDRTAYHREMRAAEAKAPESVRKATNCQWPGCNRKASLQIHHQGKDMKLCPTHHAEARRRGYGNG